MFPNDTIYYGISQITIMKKLIATLSILSLTLAVVMPVVATDISTSLTRDPGTGAAPIVKAKWEMNSTKISGIYQEGDDSTAAGAQFNPSGQYQVSKTITVCGVVTDPDGLADVDGVYADIYYPVNIYLGDNHESGRQGCGALMQEVTLNKLSKADGIELFCNKVKNNNNNLPAFNTNYNYDEICAQDGELMKETAAVYCGEKVLSYEDPSGDYRVVVMGQDKNGMSGTLENTFKYLPLTAFETDFTAINYGNVKLNTHKIINGNLTFNPADGMATVRNVGNTRLAMKVMQDDMGLGMTDTTWNVKYDGRVGSSASFISYYPNVWKTLNNQMDLSETNEMDFSIDITKFPFPPQNSYTGNMTLGASSVSHLTCPPGG